MGIRIEAMRAAAGPVVFVVQAAALVPLLGGAVSLAVVGRGMAGVAQVLALAANATAGAVAALLAGADRVNKLAGRVIVSSAESGRAARAEVAASNRVAAGSALGAALSAVDDIGAVEQMPKDMGTARLGDHRLDFSRRRGPVAVEVTRVAVLAGDAVSFAAAGAAIRAAAKAEARRKAHLAELGYIFTRRRDDEGGGL